MVRDNPKLLDGSGEVPKTERNGLWFYPMPWNIFSTWREN